MVYCGKPSKSCAECRLRRTKCDMARPSCSQCIRAGRTCKGYRDPSDFMFRDESRGLMEKAARRQSASTGAPSSQPKGSAASASVARPENRRRIAPTSSVPAGLQPSADDQATTFFFQNYIPDKDQFPTGSFQYLADVYSCEKVGQEVSDGVASLGMAGLSSFWRSPNIMVNANIKYTSALRLLSSKMRDMNEAKADQTFIAVMLLGLFETNTCHSRTSLEAWTKHTTGATALMKLRGKRQLRTKIGHHLFIHHRAQIIANCMQRGACCPSTIKEWNEALDFEDEVEHAATKLTDLYVDYTNLRGHINMGYEYADPEGAILKAAAIDAACAEWAENCPLLYTYRTIRVRGITNEVFSYTFHAYTTIWVAMCWNNYRCLRIRINELILDQLNHLAEEQSLPAMLNNDPGYHTRLTNTAHEVVVQCSNDICSSVPYILGYDPDHQGPPKVPRAFNGNLLLWPLYNAGLTERIPGYQRRWVIERLRFIADVMGVRQASPLVHSLSAKVDVGPWDGGNVSNAEHESCLVAMDNDLEITRNAAQQVLMEQAIGHSMERGHVLPHLMSVMPAQQVQVISFPNSAPLDMASITGRPIFNETDDELSLTGHYDDEWYIKPWLDPLPRLLT